MATILNQKVTGPCKIDDKGLCREFSYPNVSRFDAGWGAEHIGVLGPGYNNEHVSKIVRPV